MAIHDDFPRSHPGDGRGPHRGGAHRHLLLIILGAVCGQPGCERGEPSCEPYCANPVDRVVVPRLRELGIEPRAADPFEHCRRISIDLLGRGPSGPEIEACIDAAPDARVELAQASPDYVRNTRRVWSEVLGFDVLETYSRDLEDLDAVVARYAGGELDYAALATAVAVHPGFLALHPEDAWADAVYRVFLGRPARADEVAALRPLTRAFHARYLCEGAIWWNVFEAYLSDGETVDDAIAGAEIDCADIAKTNFGFNPCPCFPGDGSLGCATPALGVPVAFTPACAYAADPYDGANVVRIGAAVPAADDRCPDGTHHPKCRDREIDEEDFITMYPPEDWPVAGAGVRAELDTVGMALAARPDFWEAAVDRELRRFTGWWQRSFRHPDADLPEVRAALAAMLRDGASARELERVILTSQLYAAPAAAPPGWDAAAGEPPPWASGPTKLLAAEPWLDTVLRAVGETPGVCDVRNLTVYGYEWELGDWSRLEDPTSSLDGIVEDFYVNATMALGGCRARAARPTQSNVGLAFAQGEHARTACAYGRAVVPDDWDGDYAAAADHLIRRLYDRRPHAGELDELVAEMDACVDAGACVDDDAAARWLCQRLTDATELTTY
jgi:hypothetical protein